MTPQVRRIGLTELYKPSDQEAWTVDVILVHGLFGHPKDTWTYKSKSEPAGKGSSSEPLRKKLRLSNAETQETYWPFDFLPKVMPRARIFTWGYDVQIQNLFTAVSKASVFQHAETLLYDIATLRASPSGGARPIIIIAHSLGGIVVKEALCLSKTESTFFNEVLPITAGICFLGTPHRGSGTASIGKIAYGLSNILILRSPNLQILKALEVQSELLERVGRNFCQILNDGKLRVHSFREELPTKGMMVVDSFSSIIGDANETRGSIHANHREMTKFATSNDVGFWRIVGILKRWEKEVEATFQGPWAISYSQGSTTATSARRKERLIHIEDKALVDFCLSSLDHHEARARIQNVEDRYANTYNWLFENRVGFEDWLSGQVESVAYWISGKPASGKSTIMKLALNHSMTRELLKKNNASDWIIAGFFFHDRGSFIQKSIEGLLQEVLFQVLSSRWDLIRSTLEAYPNHLIIQKKVGGTYSLDLTWTPEDVKGALSLLLSEARLNLCLFIDALDEHSGNHSELFAFIDSLSHISKTFGCGLRLCLASRPENIFQQKLKDAPGFSVQDYTRGDIENFTRDKLSEIAAEDVVQFDVLVKEVIEKARGVFLWVKLAVAELMDGWLSGDTIEELRNALSEIPDELKDLYRRVIQRFIRRQKNPRALEQNRLEAYVMFQIVLNSTSTQRLGDFMRMVQSNMAGEIQNYDVFTIAQWKRRINDRSAGLLEVTENSKVPNYNPTVQFIHQTTKEFFQSDGGFQELYRDCIERPPQCGLAFVIRGTLWLDALGATKPPHLTRTIEKNHLISSLDILTDEVIFLFFKTAGVNWGVPPFLLRPVTQSDNVTLVKCFISIIFCLERSLKETLRGTLASKIAKHYGGLLLFTALHSMARCGHVSIVEELLKSGIPADISFAGESCNSFLTKFVPDSYTKQRLKSILHSR